MKLKRTRLRYFFKEALRGFLPEEIITKTKHGFGLPFGPWLQTHRPLQQLALDSLADLKKRDVVRPEFIDELTSTLLEAHAGYYGTMVWVLDGMKVPPTARHLCHAALFLGSVLGPALPALGQGGIPGYPESIQSYDRREVALLPRYCIYTQVFRERVAGGNNPASEQVRNFYLNDAIIEFDWVIERAPQDYFLMPEFLTKKGENLIRLGRASLGMLELNRAIRLKPDYEPAYAAMSDYYRDSGDVAKAREVLEKGLSQAPQARSLTKRLAELDTVKPKRRTPPK
jgi:tetratricopeptide (TPR) repeat protein